MQSTILEWPFLSPLTIPRHPSLPVSTQLQSLFRTYVVREWAALQLQRPLTLKPKPFKLARPLQLQLHHHPLPRLPLLLRPRQPLAVLIQPLCPCRMATQASQASGKSGSAARRGGTSSRAANRSPDAFFGWAGWTWSGMGGLVCP